MGYLQRDLDRIGDVHDCDPAAWTARVTTVGFDVSHAGTSTWTCDMCRPMVIEAFNRHEGRCDVVARAPRAAALKGEDQ